MTPTSAHVPPAAIGPQRTQLDASRLSQVENWAGLLPPLRPTAYLPHQKHDAPATQQRIPRSARNDKDAV